MGNFLRRFQIEFKGVGRHSGWVDEVLNLMTEVLLEKDVSLTSLESLFDPDSDGVDADDFRRALRNLTHAGLTADQTTCLFHALAASRPEASGAGSEISAMLRRGAEQPTVSSEFRRF